MNHIKYFCILTQHSNQINIMWNFFNCINQKLIILCISKNFHSNHNRRRTKSEELQALEYIRVWSLTGAPHTVLSSGVLVRLS